VTSERDGVSPGWLVCVEGIDGAGKTTAVRALGEFLRRDGAPAFVLDKATCTFTSGYVDRHMGDLRDLIWQHPPDDPFLEMGDLHWVHLQAAWYAGVAKCLVGPLLAAGRLILTDTWTHKYLAKLSMRPVDFGYVRSFFLELPRPHVVIGLRIDPAEAAARKDEIKITEAGDHEEDVARTKDAFVAYQSRLAAALEEMGEREGWRWLDVGGKSIAEVAGSMAEIVRQALPPAATGRAERASEAGIRDPERLQCRSDDGAAPSRSPNDGASDLSLRKEDARWSLGGAAW
jgi:thymidylate kinase